METSKVENVLLLINYKYDQAENTSVHHNLLTCIKHCMWRAYWRTLIMVIFRIWILLDNSDFFQVSSIWILNIINTKSRDHLNEVTQSRFIFSLWNNLFILILLMNISISLTLRMSQSQASTLEVKNCFCHNHYALPSWPPNFLILFKTGQFDSVTTNIFLQNFAFFSSNMVGQINVHFL